MAHPQITGSPDDGNQLPQTKNMQSASANGASLRNFKGMMKAFWLFQKNLEVRDDQHHQAD
jgi:hypothetical protein